MLLKRLYSEIVMLSKCLTRQLLLKNACLDCFKDFSLDLKCQVTRDFSEKARILVA